MCTLKLFAGPWNARIAVNHFFFFFFLSSPTLSHRFVSIRPLLSSIKWILDYILAIYMESKVGLLTTVYRNGLLVPFFFLDTHTHTPAPLIYLWIFPSLQPIQQLHTNFHRTLSSTGLSSKPCLHATSLLASSSEIPKRLTGNWCLMNGWKQERSHWA